MGRLTRDGTAESASRDQIFRRERGQGNIHFPCSADDVQDWHPYIHTLLYVSPYNQIASTKHSILIYSLVEVTMTSLPGLIARPRVLAYCYTIRVHTHIIKRPGKHILAHILTNYSNIHCYYQRETPLF